MSASVTILYEDQRAHGNSFGLHTLVKACVHDALSGDRYRIEKMLADARPLKGVQNVLRACREELDLIAIDGRDVIAVIDNDAIRHHLKLPRMASHANVEQEIRKGCRAPDRLFIVLLVQNTESVLTAAAECDASLDPRRIERAVEHKDMLERDAIFFERARMRRDCVLDKMPSLRTLIDLLVSKLRPAAGGTAPTKTSGTPKGKRTRRGEKP
ncbi:hypothetical protein WME97_04010 [Sorangium sp. So ce367]|uniref:hypothetical protein n=1 Tax=Sorangium sp. So ce367 TaxID=3133305 RepID=UPI003F60ECA7